MRMLLASFAAILCSSAICAQGRAPIIDVHMHADSDKVFAKPNPNPATGKDPGLKSGRDQMNATFAAMRKYNIVKGIVSGPLDVVEKWRTADPTRVMAAPYFEGTQNFPFPDIQLLTDLYGSGRLAAMGEIGAQYGGLGAADKSLEKYFALAEKLDIPVGVHTGLGPPGSAFDPGTPKFRTTLGDPRLLEEVIIRHPQLRLYVMHAGWPYLSEIKALMQQYPELYLDVAVIDWVMPREEFHEYLRALMRAGLGKRIMFGSDQMMWPEAIGMAIENIEAAPFLTRAEKRDIFYNNAARFLRIAK
jgi:hypothetical protein